MTKLYNTLTLLPPSSLVNIGRTHTTPICRFTVIRSGLSHKPSGFSRSPRQMNVVNISNIEIRQINVVVDVDSLLKRIQMNNKAFKATF